MDNYNKLKSLFPEESSLFIIRTLERVAYEDAVEVIKNRPKNNPICWNFRDQRWVEINALSLSR